MNSAPDRLATIIMGHDPEALIAAQTLTRLVVEGGILGELATRMVALPEGGAREVKTVPLEWMERLATAAERGALARYSVDQIVQHILSQPAETTP
ncbi:hypothetical protein AFEL58S_02058 [Afipia felis]